MSNDTKDQPAYPPNPTWTTTAPDPAMTLRDEFAKAALQGIAANPEDGLGELHGGLADHHRKKDALRCYRMADAMLQARIQEPK